MEAAARFLEGRKSIDVPYVVSASLYPAQAPDTGLTLAVFWMETGYAAASPHFYIEGEVYDVPFPVSAVREDRSPLLEDVERQLTLQGTLRADCIELHISGESSAGMGTQSIPVEFITGQALLSVCTQIGRKSNSTDVFIHHDVLRMVEEDPK
ncbi:MAG: hypothetical protein JSU94_11115 [Phycisphaerales bacterium]|nr:MAG: hypothetical protein JSU94_11115 [Phycisphaerales bacterium]